MKTYEKVEIEIIFFDESVGTSDIISEIPASEVETPNI